MQLLLTSSGITNARIRDALVDLLGRPVEEASALVVPTAIYPFGVGPQMAARLVRGEVATPLCELGWRSLGILELSVLPSIDRDVWVGAVEAADALLFWGGDPLFLAWWMQESGLTGLLPSLTDTVYVGTSAGAMAATTVIGETYTEPPSGRTGPLTSRQMSFATSQGDVSRTFVTGAGAGLVDFSLIPHLDHENHPDASSPNAERWAAMLPGPTYAIDDQTAVVVRDGVVEVVSEGRWRLFGAGQP